MFPQLIGPVPPAECSSIYLSQKLHTHPHSWQRPLSWGPHCCQWGEDKVNWEPRPFSRHQIMQTVPGNCGSSSIVGMHYFSQMRWPVSFLVFSQLPNHVHNCLVQYLYQPISLGVVGYSLQLVDAKDLAQFLNNFTGKASICHLRAWLGLQRWRYSLHIEI